MGRRTFWLRYHALSHRDRYNWIVRKSEWEIFLRKKHVELEKGKKAHCIGTEKIYMHSNLLKKCLTEQQR